VCPNYPTLTKFGVNIVKWSLLNANVLDLRKSSHYRITTIIVCDLARKGCKFCFFGPIVLEGTSKKSVKQRFCWGLSHVVWESFVDVGFPKSEKVG